jgi:hypothetical protein
MSSLLESMLYVPYFVWEQGDREEPPKPSSKHHPFDIDEDWGDDPPELLFSDSEDDTSVPERPRRRKTPLHQQARREDSGRHVRFSAARIREHSVILGELACCSCLPLSLDWNHGEEQIYDIDDYETMRTESGREERGKLSKLGWSERRRILDESNWAKRKLRRDRPPMKPTRKVRRDNSPDPTMAQDADEIEMIADFPATCDPFAAFRSPGWGIFGDDACGYPAMTVQVLED